MSSEIHYEIFLRRGLKASWSLEGVQERRDAALKTARELISENPSYGVRVIKETFQPDTGNFLSVKIFEEGKKGKTKTSKGDSETFLPCVFPDDLYSFHSRETISRLLEQLLKRWHVGASELMHRADLLEKLEATGTELQHAIQKYAVARSGNSNDPVHNIIRKLNDLIQNSIDQVYDDTKAKLFPKVAPATFYRTAKKVCSGARPSYVLSGGIAAYIAGGKSADEKLALLLDLLENVSGEDAAARLCCGAVDLFIADIFKSPDLTEKLTGEDSNLGETLVVMTEIFIGKFKPSNGKAAHNNLNLLGKLISEDTLPRSRVALRQRILGEIRSTKRLCPDSMDDEVAAMRQIADRLVLGQGPLLSADDITRSFSLRSRRMVSPDQLKKYQAGFTDPEQKVIRLLELETNIVGAENKRALASAIAPVMQSHHFERHFLVSNEPALKRLACIAELQSKVCRSGFQNAIKEQLSAGFDLIATQVEAETALFEKIERKNISAAEKGIAFLKLCGKGVLPEGDCKKRAKELALKYMRQPGFLNNYLEGQGSGSSAQETRQQIEQLRTLLDEAGIEPVRSLLSA